MSNIPERWLVDLLELLARAYPSGLPGADYLALLKLLLMEASQRNVADAISTFSSRERGVVYNDVLAVAGRYVEIPDSDVERVRRLTERAGYREWLDKHR